jgi:hypothetical protein
MLVRPNGRFITQREYPRMALISTQVNEEALTLGAPYMANLKVAREVAGDTRAVTVWKFDGRGVDCGDAAAAWASQYLETPLRLVRFDVDTPRVCSPEWTGDMRAVTEFADGYPILVISRASLADLNSRLPRALPMERFRPNLVIDGVDAYDEDRMHELRGRARDVTHREAVHTVFDHDDGSAAGRRRRRRAAADPQGIPLRQEAARRRIRAERSRRERRRGNPARRPGP